MARKLKVFRTSIGFHDAYVAAPSQKAALEAWGSDSNLFGTGMAELVTDPRLTKVPLAKPGQVIKVKRGTQREHMAALPKHTRTALKVEAASSPTVSRPRRTALDRIERAIKTANGARDKELEAIDAQIRALHVKRRSASDRHRAKIDRLEQRQAEEAERYEAALQAWREQ